ncbi:MAG: hypothetical protein DMG67_01485 [Acidobacteria bacterium]|nr:MAG: hypothetical protein DMG67_01485 [Acidobacteriota bacterium]
MVKVKLGIAFTGLGVHVDGGAVAPGWQLKETALLNPLDAATVPSKTVCWPGKMGPPTVPPPESKMETVKSAGWTTTTVPCIADR